jgi:hypothetical protein
MNTARIGAALAIALGVLLQGCSRAPSIDILGSFFPVWMLCGIAGVTVAFIAHKLFVRLKLETYLGPPALVYPSLALLFACLLWLIFYR